MFTRVLSVALGGMIGSVLRYATGGLVHRFSSGGFPWGTLTVNVLGCTALGFLATLSEDRGLLRPEMRLFLFVGLLGGFTTFSTFGYESFSFLREGIVGSALLNIGLNLVLGLVGVWLGHVAARVL